MKEIIFGLIFIIVGILYFKWTKKSPPSKAVYYLQYEGYGLSIVTIILGLYLITKGMFGLF